MAFDMLLHSASPCCVATIIPFHESQEQERKCCCPPSCVLLLLGVAASTAGQTADECPAGVTALSLLITPFLMQASNKWLLLADPEAGTLVSYCIIVCTYHSLCSLCRNSALQKLCIGVCTENLRDSWHLHSGANCSCEALHGVTAVTCTGMLKAKTCPSKHSVESCTQGDKHGCRCSSLQSYANLAHLLPMMDCPLCCHPTAKKCTPRDEGTPTLHKETVAHRTAPPCLRQVLSTLLRPVYNSGMHFCDIIN